LIRLRDASQRPRTKSSVANVLWTAFEDCAKQVGLADRPSAHVRSRKRRVERIVR
jgi:hypothetical protein